MARRFIMEVIPNKAPQKAYILHPVEENKAGSILLISNVIGQDSKLLVILFDVNAIAMSCNLLYFSDTNINGYYISCIPPNINKQILTDKGCVYCKKYNWM